MSRWNPKTNSNFALDWETLTGPEVFQILARENHRTLFAIAFRVLHQREAALDIVQETYFQAYQKLDTLCDQNPTTVLAWLKRIAFRRALNAQRAQRNTFVSFDEQLQLWDDNESECSNQFERLRSLELAMLTLAPDERALCERFYRGNWSIERLASVAGIHPAAMRKRISRLRTQLREEIIMTTTQPYQGRLPKDLPDQIVSLLAQPTLTVLPENPVGATWQAVVASLPGYTEVTLPETVDLTQLALVVGVERMQQREYEAFAIDQNAILRPDTSMPLLVELVKQPKPGRFIASGKVYRDGPLDARHLHAFHQAEVLVVGPNASEWELAQWLTELGRQLFRGAKLRLEEIDFPFMCSRAFELWVNVDNEWAEVAAFGRFHDDIAERLGGKGHSAVGAGIGLERWAQLAYGIDDVRKISAIHLPMSELAQ